MPVAGYGAFPFAPGELPRYARPTRPPGRNREALMGANLAIVTLVVVFSIVIGLYIGGKLRRKR
ncbi:hypothetical protein NY78_3736 [Desulfovibrio sp. TomC]|nr:hypothetical protein NY78_3736 [Desulfovibrio sp. TomC]